MKTKNGSGLMIDWVKTVSLGLVVSFILGAFAVMANDKDQSRRLVDVEAQADNHDEQIRILRESKIAVEKDISQIQRDVQRIAVAVEKLAD